MFHFKACLKCHGDMYSERDSYGTFLKYLQCGRIVDVEMEGPGHDKGAVQEAATLAA